MTAAKKRATHGGPRPGAGRPASVAEPRLLTRQVRCSASEVARWERCAAIVGMPFAVIARAAIDAWCAGVEAKGE